MAKQVNDIGAACVDMETNDKSQDKENDSEVMLINIDSDSDDEKEVNKTKENREKIRASKRQRKNSNDESVDVASQVECVNPCCESGVALVPAPVFVLTHYGVRYKSDVRERVCNKCYIAAENHEVKLMEMLKNGEPLYKAEFPTYKNDVVTMDKLEDLREEEPLPKDIISMVNKNFNSILSDAMAKYKIDYQIDEAMKVLEEKYETITRAAYEAKTVISSIENQLVEIRNKVYSPFRNRYKHLPAVDLSEPNANYRKLSASDRQWRKPPKFQQEPKCVLPPTTVISNEDVIHVREITANIDALPKGVMKYEPLRVGSQVYAPKTTLINVWILASIVEVDPRNVEKPYIIEFKSVRKMARRSVSCKMISYNYPSHYMHEAGTRVVAFFQNHDRNDAGAYYVGVVGEPPKTVNKYRYLIFFDDGFTQYVDNRKVFQVVEACPRVWEDVYVDNRPFIERYLATYPELPILRMKPDQTLKVLHRDSWQNAKVIATDASLVKIQYLKNNRTEWIYRGSTTLKPLYDKLVKNARGMNMSFLKKNNMPYVEYKRPEVENNKTVAVKSTQSSTRNIAKKSTSNNMRPDKNAGPLGPNDKAEIESKGVVRKMLLKNRIASQKFVPHNCSSTCVSWISHEQMNLKKYPPLAIPLVVGFSRMIVDSSTRNSPVYYVGPCGRSLRNIVELRTYLRTTCCKLGIDLFDFNGWVKPMNQFYIKPSALKMAVTDISFGAENRPVPCVNELYEGFPSKMIYSAKRLPQSGVNINTDPAFMVCCDCSDDCFNKEKCACWQLTLRPTRSSAQLSEYSVGYTNRRLLDGVSTGIYECHSGCRCTSTCQNRVVQFPLSQNLQVFRTYRKGWGIRTLNDIPIGAFVCIYVGRLLTEASANEGGRVFGDEYLAELDYIEIAQSYKDNYESDVEDIDTDSDSQKDYELDEDDKDEDDSSSGEWEETSRENSIRKIDRKARSYTTRASKEVVKKKSLRQLYGETNQDVYIMDAKYEGNIGRYLNHSCDPNMFVQNVFIDTHDPRFPWIAFFAATHISAGSELTWDYNYNIGSVPGKVLWCYCGTSECRGRLL